MSRVRDTLQTVLLTDIIDMVATQLDTTPSRFFLNDIYIIKYLQVKLLLLEYKEETDKVLDFKEFTVSRAEINCKNKY